MTYNPVYYFIYFITICIKNCVYIKIIIINYFVREAYFFLTIKIVILVIANYYNYNNIIIIWLFVKLFYIVLKIIPSAEKPTYFSNGPSLKYINNNNNKINPSYFTIYTMNVNYNNLNGNCII